MKTPEKLTLNSPELRSQSPISGNLAKLQLLFPSVVREGKVDFDALRQLLGNDVAKEDELFGLQWHGKARARRNALVPSLGTLRPCKEESKNWDSTKNLYIEGDNLEVLKLLQKSYAGKVKMIYIDPPYNTGKEFVYPDDYQNGIQNYLNLTGQQDKFKANAETSGRYHTDWLNMMYPRLMLARELLSDDGVIFISIDDHEDCNLLQCCNEIYGSKNFIAQLIWQRAFSPKNDARYVSNSHDYILMFAKNIETFRIGRLERTEEANARYSNPDNDPRGVWMSSDISVKTYNEECDYPITTPSGRVVEPPAGRCWRLSQNAFCERLRDGRIWFGPDGDGTPRIKRFLSELRFEGMAPTSILLHKEVGHSQEGAQEVVSLFENKGVFDGPKPVRLLERLITLANLEDDSIVVDFFSGSATTAHAILKYNAQKNKNCRFILTQMPEFCDNDSTAAKAGYVNICEIGKERIRRAGEKVKAEAGLGGQNLDIGFRVFKLDTSNVMPWSTEPGQLNLQLENESNLRPERTSEDIFYEVLLKQGIELTEDSRSKEIAGHTVYSLGYGLYYCCFDAHIGTEAQELAADIARWHEEEDPDGKDCVVYVRDSAFDSSNTMQGVNGDEGDARKKSFCQTLDQSGILKVKAF
ncbi:MAG: site-specific DNA-methyltransferase [Akkermansiaceae bacterium]|nr:site-specific DNA-methyltransferase [Akkermansiaceae bacterium]